MKETNKFAGRNEATIKPTSKDLLIQVNSFDTPLYIFARFEPEFGKETQLRALHFVEAVSELITHFLEAVFAQNKSNYMN